MLNKIAKKANPKMYTKIVLQLLLSNFDLIRTLKSCLASSGLPPCVHRVRQHVLQYLPSDASILELNSGTGDDALFFAKQGYHIRATDISVGMQQQLAAKAQANQMHHLISNELFSSTQLKSLKKSRPVRPYLLQLRQPQLHCRTGQSPGVF